MNHENASPDPRIGFFDQTAHRWDTDEQDPAETVHRLEQLADRLALADGQDLLEVGCGTGQITGWLAGKVSPGRVTAVDFSPEMLAKARGKGIDAEFRQVDVCEDDLGRGVFDVALCFHSFPHFRNHPAALANITASLKQGGRLIVLHLLSRDELNAFHDEVGQEVHGDHLPSDEGFAGLLDEAGLKLDELTDQPGLFLLIAHKP